MSVLLDPALTTPENDRIEAPAVPAGPTFAELGLPAPLLRAVTDLGFVTPSAIQEKAIPALLDGRDITGVAQTGTGKTAAFGLPLLAAIDPSLGRVQAVVLTPTRELAIQVSEAITTFAAQLPRITVVPIYGGASFLPQRAALKAGAQVVVGTPGRIIDHLERGTLDITGLRFLVLDEADEMLRMGFAEDVDKILESAPNQRQTALFSATMPPAIRAVAGKHLVDPVDITVARQSSTVTSVKQTYAVVPFRDKVDALTRVIQTSDGDATIVFVRTKEACDQVGTELVARGIGAAAINGDVPQKERERIIDRLRTGKLDVLVATDVAARGLDVDRIDLVVNFDAPGEVEAYVHRIGRTGRAGRTGIALTFFTPREIGRLRLIEKTTRTTMEQIDLPSQDDVWAHGGNAVLRQVQDWAGGSRKGTYRGAVNAFLGETGMSAEDLAATLLALAAGDDGSWVPPVKEQRPERRPRFDEEPAQRGGNRPDRPRRRDAAGPRYRVAVGRRHGVRPAGIVGAITAEGGLSGSDLGRIDIFDDHSIVEIGGHISREAFGRISRATVSGQALQIKLERDGGPSHAPRGSGPARDRDRGPRRPGDDRGGERRYGNREYRGR
ncbi:DEAD/DEAH box helicase [Nakamurella sp. YIM 132087]|uniref:RNA helicase n=1 Tax=Nakamurella alba TaxID=2665158 RepID=A0A7K1FQB9_9ACTN|nr:DEAD/DEAH box helicase [Nakamurella alba]MTD16331.1 DEAD/DEAH box helicase [Nakamurella alba]